MTYQNQNSYLQGLPLLSKVKFLINENSQRWPVAFAAGYHPFVLFLSVRSFIYDQSQFCVGNLLLLGDFVVLVSTNFRATYHSDIFIPIFSSGASNLFRLILIQIPCPSLTSTAPQEMQTSLLIYLSMVLCESSLIGK